jgi:ABC-2 type transport system permease protein
MKHFLSRLGRGFVRPFSFLPKETLQIARQPRLIVTLIIAPFLVLLLFGVGYSGHVPTLETVLVVPADQGLSTDIAQYRDDFVSPFELVAVTTQRDIVIELVRQREIDIAVILPQDAVEKVSAGEQAEIEVYYNELVPFQVDWLGFYSRVQTSEINRRVLVGVIQSANQNNTFDLGFLNEYNAGLQENQQVLEQQIANDEREQALSTVAAMRQNTASATDSTLQAAAFVTAVSLSLGSPETAPVVQSDNFQTAQDALGNIDTALGNVEQQLQSEQTVAPEDVASDMEQVRQNQDALAGLTSQIQSIPAEVLVSPFKSSEVNLAPTEPNFVAYYTPAVLALLIQHIAVTLTALTLVRERLTGSLEYFRVAPLSAGEMLVGKYIAYFLQSCALAAILVVIVLFTLDVPMEGDWGDFAVAIGLLIVASMGIGLLISAVSRTETQAVQLAMLVLLASVFFSGFFLPLENLTEFVRGLSYALPVTYGIASLQELMLRGELPPRWMVWAPAALAAALFILTWIALRHQFRRV